MVVNGEPVCSPMCFLEMQPWRQFPHEPVVRREDRLERTVDCCAHPYSVLISIITIKYNRYWADHLFDNIY